ncbi:putative bifunctional diguanylate cyclase/phosphodiesterase [Nocardia sp. alder85J]|uniref:putative bifunctional diguanylate cyclase/phosphodiesterase n=1 Tax=Nocardia sp. alder85J TaxID=2862949 RepID=UPI001CD36FB8|nr:bifunctional diguanylate cyclase/phosphodiesterase [Nocardia sp. alder85J]MCX4098260.1 bifunctional diguanylate cyclase/phosphodiesterase [Nocardia sp. alder85J]
MAWDGGSVGTEAGDTAELARGWAAALASGAREQSVAPGAAAVIQLLTRLADGLDTAARQGDTQAAVALGAELARARFIDDEVLGRSVATLSAHFAAHGVDAAAVLGAFGTGYLRAFRAWLLAEQEGMRAAEIAARRAAEQRLRDSEARLRFHAHHDPLTGLANRSRFFDGLTVAFADSGALVGLCHIDLDGLESVNETLGHVLGDELLIQVAARVAALAGGERLAARTGGDEFAILVPDASGNAELAGLADAVLRALADPFEVHGQRLTMTAGIGVAAERAELTHPDELLQAADTALYWAKADGRGRWAMFDPERQQREQTRLDLVSELPGAVARGEFFLEYQPIVTLADHRPGAVEALVRWRHPEEGVLAPGRFIDLAEDSGHIGALGSEVLTMACRQARQWHDRLGAAAPVVSVNVSAAEVDDGDWLPRVQDTIADTGIPTWQLQLELTERTFMHTTGRPLQALRILADSGVRIAIDDFGTGYSNLAYLGRLPLHVVKLAGPFIQRIRTPGSAGRNDLLVLESIIGLSHALGLTVTAECVETRYQADRLLELGCDSAQGWLFHRPLAVERATEQLTAAASVAD